MFRRRNTVRAPFDRERQVAVLRVSICSGEKTLAFRDKESGRTEQVGCVRSDREYKALLREYGIGEEEVKKEW